MDASSISIHFNRLTFYQEILVELMAKDRNIRERFISIQSMLISHLEAMERKMTIAKDLAKRDPHLSIADSLVDLVAQLEIQVQSLYVEIDNWDESLKIILELHKPFLDKHTVSVPSTPHSVKKGYYTILNSNFEDIFQGR